MKSQFSSFIPTWSSWSLLYTCIVQQSAKIWVEFIPWVWCFSMFQESPVTSQQLCLPWALTFVSSGKKTLQVYFRILAILPGTDWGHENGKSCPCSSVPQVLIPFQNLLALGNSPDILVVLCTSDLIVVIRRRIYQ